MILNQFSLSGKTAVITGCSQGIGNAIAAAMAEAGADVVGVDIVPQPCTKKKVEETGRCYLELEADLVDCTAFDDVVDKTIERFGHLDILVNNAGITRRNMAVDFSEEAWDAVIAINQKAVFFNAQKAARQFIKQKTPGKIINIASVNAFEGGVKVIAYTAAKAAVRMITMAMSNEWASLGINVNAIAPGFTVTQLTEPMRGEEDRVKEMMTRIPIGRWAKPDDMAGAAVFLASPASSYISGATIVVDGGYLGR
ncbi:MAG: glucose 1-dehydrogenase [Treponema sp.]|jgi:2-deoxy-D-gluconate 3-dehydrogenase|nr:glucose 1-dehydrogenase [Treponema sp.]